MKIPRTFSAAAQRPIKCRPFALGGSVALPTRAGKAPEAQTTEQERITKARQEVTKRIKMLGEQNKTREAIQELAGLAKLGIKPDTQAATALIKACARDMNLATSIFNELFTDFLVPDEITFAVLLRGFGSKEPPAWTEIDTTLTNMRFKFRIPPTATSFNVLLEICTRTSDVGRGLEILDRMAADGVEPDEYTEEIINRKRALRSAFRKLFM